MKTIEIIRKATADKKFSSDTRNCLRQILQSGFARTGKYQGRGRYAKAVNNTEDVCSALRTLRIAHATGNDAPRGGVMGCFVILTSEAVMKEIGKTAAYKQLRRMAGLRCGDIEWKYQKPKGYTRDELVARAEQELSFVNAEDEKDEDGRYWLNCYHGCGTYELAVKDGRIAASLHQGFHPTLPRGKNRIAPTREEWIAVLSEVVAAHIGEGFHWVKADGSGTYFYLRNDENIKLLSKVKEYDVPDMVNGGGHHNIEIR